MLEDIGDWLEEAPIERTIMLGALTNSSGFSGDDFGYTSYNWDGTEIRAAFLWNGSNYPMSVAANSEIDAAQLGDDLMSYFGSGMLKMPNRVVGPVNLVWNAIQAAFAGDWTEEHRLLCYRLADGAMPPALPDGCSLQWATAEDREMVVEWSIGFGRDTGLPPEEWERSHVESRAGRRLTGDNLLFLISPDGQPLSMAGHSRCGKQLARIGGVYTPAPLRGKGYAAITVAHLCQALRKRGIPEICLFADAANPTSNALYQRIGFKLHSEQCTVRRVDHPN